MSVPCFTIWLTARSDLIYYQPVYNRYGVRSTYDTTHVQVLIITPQISETEPLDASPFDTVYFREVLHTLTIDIHITESEPDLLHPTRPKLYFSSDDVNQPFTGWVAYTPEEHVRWYFVRPLLFHPDNPIYLFFSRNMAKTDK